jgi:hypothetical protein
MPRRTIATAVVGGAIALSGCAGVSPEPGAEEVEILEEERTAQCERQGQTRVTTATEVGFIKRGDKAIREDLRALARNSAVDMGGDTVTPLNEITEGKQTYGVYKCVDD